jgi:hypothetical protein
MDFPLSFRMFAAAVCELRRRFDQLRTLFDKA